MLFRCDEQVLHEEPEVLPGLQQPRRDLLLVPELQVMMMMMMMVMMMMMMSSRAIRQSESVTAYTAVPRQKLNLVDIQVRLVLICSWLLNK